MTDRARRLAAQLLLWISAGHLSRVAQQRYDVCVCGHRRSDHVSMCGTWCAHGLEVPPKLSARCSCQQFLLKPKGAE